MRRKRSAFDRVHDIPLPRPLFLVMLCGLGLMINCGKSEPPPPSPASKPHHAKHERREKPTSSQPPQQEELAVMPRYEYNPMGKRDPFQRYQVPELQISPDFPLTGFELKSLKLVGIVVGLPEPKAVFEAPDGKSYVIEAGGKIGKNDGTVVKILPDEVIIVEKRVDRTGNLRDEQVSVKLYPEQGGTL
ncbi:MAG: hypothetical protein D6812_13255 [Deltaproteobacteria bacterium]|nr:MAG: hypothetical protein D6812_13255 [Deltaproteobacteria bacterium]